MENIPVPVESSEMSELNGLPAVTSPIAASPPIESYACPICGRTSVRKWRPLYDVPVCRKCRNSFLWRRRLGFVIEIVCFQFISIIVVPLIVLSWMQSGYSGNLFDVGVIVFRVGWPFLFAFRDSFRGRSPGKWLFGLQVVDRLTREPIGAWRSLKRNFLVCIPVCGGFFALGIAFLMASGRRWGDGLANTEVIWLKYRSHVPFEPRPNICRSCGYDLTGNVSGRCPECGQVIPDSARAMIAINSGQSSPKIVD